MLVSRRGELLAKILDTIANAAIAFGRHPSRNSLSVYRALRDFENLQTLSDRQLRMISRYVIERKYVKISRSVSGDSTISVTENGKAIVAYQALLSLKPKPQNVWDRMWRLVMFDIPTEMKSARDRFASVLKTLGFVHYQKSVFICPHPCEEELEVIAEYLGISQYIDIVLAKCISREREYRREFDLPNGRAV